MATKNDEIKEPLKKYTANDYVAFPCINTNFLSVEECSKVIEMGKGMPIEDGSIGQRSSSQMHLHSRYSKIKWVGYSTETVWLFEKIYDAIMIANCNYKFDIDDEIMTLQLAEYTVGGHYVWHSDVGKGASSYRKLSMTVQLSDPDDYNGGDLEFMIATHNAGENQRKQGAAVIFPSFLEHRVTTVTKGSRWSIVVWICGPPFR